MKRDVGLMKDEKQLERNKIEQLNVEIEELEAKCGLYKHNNDKLQRNFELEVSEIISRCDKSCSVTELRNCNARRHLFYEMFEKMARKVT